MNQEFELIAKTFQGLEEVLAQELTELGASNIEIGRRMVSFTGDKAMMYKANFCLRTAIRILKPIKHFTAKTADEVYEAVKSIAWENYLDNMSSFSVDAVVFSNEFRHSKFVAYKVRVCLAGKKDSNAEISFLCRLAGQSRPPGKSCPQRGCQSHLRSRLVADARLA